MPPPPPCCPQRANIPATNASARACFISMPGPPSLAARCVRRRPASPAGCRSAPPWLRAPPPCPWSKHPATTRVVPSRTSRLPCASSQRHRGRLRMYVPRRSPRTPPKRICVQGHAPGNDGVGCGGGGGGLQWSFFCVFSLVVVVLSALYAGTHAKAALVRVALARRTCQ